MTCKEKIIIDIEDNTRQYYLDEVTCFEKPFVVLLNDYKNKYGQYFLFCYVKYYGYICMVTMMLR